MQRAPAVSCSAPNGTRHLPIRWLKRQQQHSQNSWQTARKPTGWSCFPGCGSGPTAPQTPPPPRRPACLGEGVGQGEGERKDGRARSLGQRRAATRPATGKGGLCRQARRSSAPGRTFSRTARRYRSRSCGQPAEGSSNRPVGTFRHQPTRALGDQAGRGAGRGWPWRARETGAQQGQQKSNQQASQGAPAAGAGHTAPPPAGTGCGRQCPEAPPAAVGARAGRQVHTRPLSNPLSSAPGKRPAAPPQSCPSP